MKNKWIIPAGLIAAGAALLLFRKPTAANGHLFFSVQYLTWPAQEVDITQLIINNPGQTEASLRTFYSSGGYTIVREYYQ